MRDLVWELFKETGNIAYYELYRELSEDGRNNKSRGSSRHGLQRKR